MQEIHRYMRYEYTDTGDIVRGHTQEIQIKEIHIQDIDIYRRSRYKRYRYWRYRYNR